MKGLVHVYCGKGKGKTTAAVGLSVRAAGAGKRVLFVQFFKNGQSSELEMLKLLPGLKTLTNSKPVNFFLKMNEEQKAEAAEIYSELLDDALNLAKDFDMLVLDEIISTCHYGIVEQAKLLSFIENRPEGMEVVLTGRNPSEKLMELADYITEMTKIKHPYDRDIPARKGIEF